MIDALLELLSSKKLMLAILSMIAWLVAKLGLHMDPTAAFMWLSPLIAAIVGQGIADHGKSAALINARVAGRLPLSTRAPANLSAPADGNSLPMQVASGAGVLALIVTCVVASSQGCGTLKTDAKTGADSFLACGKQDLTKLVGGTGLSLLATVSNDLISGNYADAIAALVSQVGNDAVGCAVLAVDTVVAAGKQSGAAALTPIELHAMEMIKKYGWREAPAAPAPAAKAGSGAMIERPATGDQISINSDVTTPGSLTIHADGTTPGISNAITVAPL